MLIVGINVCYVPLVNIAADRPGLTAWSSTADSFEDEAIDDAANRALLCEVGTDQAVRGLAP